jgi:predicted nuclease of restriction endonuclease-like RecB superfamily
MDTYVASCNSEIGNLVYSEIGNLVTEIEELPTKLTAAEDERLQRCFRKVLSKWNSFENNATVAVENTRTDAERRNFSVRRSHYKFYRKLFCYHG